jgi:hypothetical protein
LRLKVLLVLLVIVSLALAALALFITPVQNQNFSNEMRMALDGQIQSASKDIPFTYEIKSARRTISSPNSLDGWCVIISPPLKMILAPSGSLSSVSHFFIARRDFTFDTLRFEDTENDHKRWQGIGCGAW